MSQAARSGSPEAYLPDSPLLDEQRFDTLRTQAGPVVIAEIVALFVDDMRMRLDQLERARSEQQCSDAAHAIKGAAGNLGASRLAAIAAEIEKGGAPPSQATVRSRIVALRDELERVIAALESEVRVLQRARRA